MKKFLFLYFAIAVAALAQVSTPRSDIDWPAGSANQVFRRNAANTDFEFYTPQARDRSLLADMRPEKSAHKWRPISGNVTVTTTAVSVISETSIPGAVIAGGWNDPRLQPFGVARIAANGASYPNNLFASAADGVTGLFNATGMTLEFWVTGSVFEIFHSAQALSVKIDDQFHSLRGTYYGNPGGIQLTKFVFAQPGNHKINFYGNSYGAVNVESQSAWEGPRRRLRTFQVIADSVGEGTGAENSFGYAVSLANKFGWALCNSSSGSTGFTAGNNTTRFPYYNRLQDVAAVQADIILVVNSVNDQNTVTTPIAGDLFDGIAAASPRSRVIAVGPMVRNTDTSYDNTVGASAAATKAAAEARGILFIDTRNWNLNLDAECYAVGAGFAATSTVSGGAVTGITVTNGGTGWAVPLDPASLPVTLTQANFTVSGPGTGLTFTATLGNYTLKKIDLLSGGSGYATAPTVVISGGGGTGATATATVANGRIVSVTVTNGGSGFTGRPDITFVGGGAGPGGIGSGGAFASGYVTGTITSATVTNGGSGWVTPPSITITPDVTHPNTNGHDVDAEHIAFEIERALGK